MRAYKFLNEKWGLAALRERRLKQSRINQLNDPFELRPYDLTNPDIRRAFLMTREQLHLDKGMVCFSSDWSDPVIWAHYSDGHKGLCLGFEIPDTKGDVDTDESSCVSYIAEPLHFPDNFQELAEKEGFEIVRRILFTKFKHWEYEHEIRVWAPLQHQEGNLHFLEFDEKLKLVEIILGANCKLSRSEIGQALGASPDGVAIIKARAAYDRFGMVGDEDPE